MLRLTKVRQEKGLSQRELARRSGVSQPEISKIESGKMKAYPAYERKLAAALGVKVSQAAALMEEVP